MFYGLVVGKEQFVDNHAATFVIVVQVAIKQD